MTEIGPHLLGRLPLPPDDRDWGTQKLHEHLAMITPVSDAVLNGTVRDAAKSMLTWKDVLAFASALWAWIKHQPAPGPAPVPPTPNLWGDLVVLDQGNFGTCVGNAGAGWLASAPVEDPGVNETFARQLYYESTCYDGSCDATGNAGSTSRSLAKALAARKRIVGYAFAKNLTEIDEWLLSHGPVVVGMDWTEDMFDPDADGTAHATGKVAGGHEWLVRYKLPGTDLYRCRNSWGVNWGDKGDFLISAADLTTLLLGIENEGDALLMAELPAVTIILAAAFVATQTIDYLLYLQAPYLEANVVPFLSRGSVFEMKIAAVAVVVAGAWWLVRRGRENARILSMARAVLLVGTGVAIVSIMSEIGTLTGAL